MEIGRRFFLKKILALSCALPALFLFWRKPALAGDSLIDISNIIPGQSRTVMWKGLPIFIRHRTAEEIRLAREADLAKLPDPEVDSTRVHNAEWLVLIGSCTHLGCIPMANADGWICPCHSSQYDLSGRVTNGPARKNMKIPPYRFIDSDTIALGA